MCTCVITIWVLDQIGFGEKIYFFRDGQVLFISVFSNNNEILTGKM